MQSLAQPARKIKLGFDPDYLPAFEDKLFIEGPQTGRRLVNFFVLLLLATVIATYGVLSNSTATVIGAMIVAPLMGPIMATTSAVVMGSLNRALRAMALVAAGVASVILFAYLLAWIVPDVTISFTKNAEITSRINPGLYALLTALGAGAAGAFIISRAEIADSMGGVAIAISLVPPLCVVGIALRQGQWDAAGGAMLLFATNFLAILLAGGIVLSIVGLGRASATKEQTWIRRSGLALFVAGILIVSIPLSLTTYQSVIRAVENNKVTAEIENWVNETSYQVDSVNVNDQAVIVTVEGMGELKSLNQLVNDIALVLGRPVSMIVRTVPAQVVSPNSP